MEQRRVIVIPEGIHVGKLQNQVKKARVVGECLGGMFKKEKEENIIICS